MINMPGGPEIAVILVIALIVLGPQQLPKAMRTLGNAMAEIRKISNGFQAEMRSAMDAIETSGGESTATSSPTVTASSPSTTPSDTTADPTVDPTTVTTDSGVTEVVARNPASGPSPADPSAGPSADTPATTAGSTDPTSGDEPPRIDPADRAAG